MSLSAIFDEALEDMIEGDTLSSLFSEILGSFS